MRVGVPVTVSVIRRARAVAVLLLLGAGVFLRGPAVSAQTTTGSIVGTVRDESGAALPGRRSA